MSIFSSLIGPAAEIMNFLISPIAAGFGFAIPQAEMATMMPILTGMLGLAGMRSFEKVKKV